MLYCFRCLVLLVMVLFCGSWGFLVHRTVTQLAIYQLPKKMQPFFYTHKDWLVRESVSPDVRRNTHPNEGPRHFIDLESYGDSAAWKMPVDWERARKQFSKDTLFKYGYLPYEVLRVKSLLTAAFRKGQTDSILLYAADLSHYIGDAHVPLHVSLNYDGQLTNQKGLHSLWETMIPEIELNQFTLYNGHESVYLADPARSIWNAIQDASTLVPGVFAGEKLASMEFNDSTKYRIQVRKGKEYRSYTSAFEKSYNARLGNTVNEQLLRSSNLIADFWYTCWVDAGRPDLNALLQQPFTRKNKKELKSSCKAFRKGELIQKNLLISRQDQHQPE